MKWEEKLSYFAHIMLGQAEAIKKRARRDNAAKTEAAVKAALEEARAEINETIQTKTHEAQKESYKKIAAAIYFERANFAQKRQSAVNHLFLLAEKQIKDFISSDEYKNYLQELIVKTTKTEAFSIIRLMPRDRELGLVLPSFLSAETHESDFLGGFILYNKTRTQRADYSLLKRLKIAKEGWVYDGG